MSQKWIVRVHLSFLYKGSQGTVDPTHLGNESHLFNVLLKQTFNVYNVFFPISEEILKFEKSPKLEVF